MYSLFKKVNCVPLIKSHCLPLVYSNLFVVNTLYKSYFIHKSDECKIKYTNYNNKLTKTIQLSEKQYNSHTILQAKGNIKRVWQNINKYIIGLNGSNNYNRQSVQEIKSHHSLITDSEDIANKFNDFSNIGINLANKIPPELRNISEYLSGVYTNSMLGTITDQSEILM